MKNLCAVPILLLALTTASGSAPYGQKEFRGLTPAEQPKTEPQSALEHPVLSVVVRMDEKGRVYVNKELVGRARDTGKLRKRLARVFSEKRRLLDGPQGAGIDEATREEFKSKPVTLYAPTSAKYWTVVKVLDALKAEGCRVGLVVDDPPAPPDK